MDWNRCKSKWEIRWQYIEPHGLKNQKRSDETYELRLKATDALEAFVTAKQNKCN